MKKKDIINILESVGISKTNSYYIVKQGKIAELATLKDSGRLKLLREIAGAKIYDQKKADSELILNDSDAKSQQISKSIEEIEQKISGLEAEKGELQEYNLLVTKKSCTEYCIYDSELNHLKVQFEESLKKSNEYEQEYHLVLTKVEETITSWKDTLHSKNISSETINKLEISLSSLKQERSHSLSQQITELNLKLSSLQDLEILEQNVIFILICVFYFF